MAVYTNRLLKGTVTGAAVAMTDLNRTLPAGRTEALEAEVRAEAELRAASLIQDVRQAAAAIIAEAEGEADAIRNQARAEGQALGYTEGQQNGEQSALAALQPLADSLRAAVDNGTAIRAALLAGVADQAVALALDAARRVVGEAARSHAGLAADVVRDGLRGAVGRVLRVRVHPEDVEPVSAALQQDAREIRVLPDDSIEIGGCIINVEGGVIDLRLETQLDSLARAFTGEE